MSSLWQHPYVSLLKHYDVLSWKKSSKEGDVTTLMDRSIKCSVIRVSGVIPANNYVQLPKTASQSLGLTGRYLYIAFRPVPERYFVAHVDVASMDGLVVRVSFSNLFKEFKSTSTWLQFPFLCAPARGSVEHATSALSRSDHVGPAPSSTRWTLLCLDLQYVLSIYLNRSYSHVKSTRMCANVFLKGIYTSENFYEPGLSYDECSKKGLIGQGFTPLPREMSFPLKRTDVWHDKYDIIRFPSESTKRPFDSMQTTLKRTPLEVTGGSAPTLSSPSKTIATGAAKSFTNAATKPRTKVSAPVTFDLPEITPMNSDNASPTERTGREVHVYTEGGKGRRRAPQSGRESKLSGDRAGKSGGDGKHERHHPRSVIPSNVGVETATEEAIGQRSRRPLAEVQTAESGGGDGSTLEALYSSAKSPTRVMIPEMGKAKYRSLQPDPILKLKKIIGFGGCDYKTALWTHGSSHLVYPSQAIVVILHIQTGRQRFLIGHTDKVSSVTMPRSSELIASCQAGPLCAIRIWAFDGDCLAVFKLSAHSLHTLSFSDTGRTLCAAGRDNHGKTVVAVWNTARVPKGAQAVLLAKAHTDVQVITIRVSPFDDCRLVSCGSSNVRVWRLKDSSLRSAAVPLGEHQQTDLTDVCWDCLPCTGSTGPADLSQRRAEDRKIYACSRSGYIFEIDHTKLSVSAVHRLLPKVSSGLGKQTFSTGGGLGLTSLHVNDTFCVTGSEDGYLRVWPLDFKHVYLEAEHEGPVTVVRMSANGLKILAGTSTGNLGVLDIATRNYTTLMRSHTAEVLSFSIDPLKGFVGTVSADHTIRIWNVNNVSQLYDFHSPNECPTAIVYHPSEQVFVCGFDNGCVRAFDIGATCLIAEHTPHKDSVTGLIFSPHGDRLYSGAASGELAMYDSSDRAYTVSRLLGNMLAPPPSDRQEGSPDSLSLSPSGRCLAFVGPQNFVVTVVNAQTLDEVMRLDITLITTPIEAARGTMAAATHVHYCPHNTGHLLVTTANNRLLKFDARSGKLVAEINNLHRTGCTALAMTRSGRRMITGGDRTIKVWDYQMRLDVNFQVFIGHAGPVNRVQFTPSGRELVSCGRSLFVWDYLGSSDDGLESIERLRDNEKMNLSGNLIRDSSDSNESDEENDGGNRSIGGRPIVSFSTSKQADKSMDGIPRSAIPEPSGEWIQENASGPSLNVSAADAMVLDSIIKERRSTQKSPAKLSASDRQRSPVSSGHDHRTPSQPMGPNTRPIAKTHFIARETHSELAMRRYSASEDQAGLELIGSIGYNGNGRKNMVWQPETGFFAYTIGCIITVEDLGSDSRQIHLLGHPEEISTLALQGDGVVLASASGPRGLYLSQIRLWTVGGATSDVNSSVGKELPGPHHNGGIVALAFSRDDRFLVSLGDFTDPSLIVWSTHDRHMLCRSRTVSPQNAVVWNPHAVCEFTTVGEEASVLFWLVEERSLGGGGEEGGLRVSEPTVPGELLKSNGSAERSFTCAVYAPDGIMYAGDTEGVVTAWDTRTNTCFLHWVAENGEIGSIAVCRGLLVTASISRSIIRQWSVAGVPEMRTPSHSEAVSQNSVTMDDEMALDGGVVSACFDASLDMGIVGTEAGTLWYVNWADRTSVRLVTSPGGYSSPIRDLHFLPPSTSTGEKIERSEVSGRFVTSAEDGSVRMWSVDERAQQLQFQVAGQECLCVAVSPIVRDSHVFGSSALSATTTDGSSALVAAGYSNGTLRVFDFSRAEMAMKVHPHRAPIMSIIYCGATFLLSGDESGLIAVTSTVTGLTTRLLTDHKGAAVLNFDIDKLTSSSQSGSIRWLACSSDRRVSVWKSDFGSDSCQLQDWLSFPAPPPEQLNSPKSLSEQFGVERRAEGVKGQGEGLPPSVARFSPSERDMVVYTGYGMEKAIHMYDLGVGSVVRSIPLTQWPRSLNISPQGHLIAAGLNGRLLQLIDYSQGSFQDFVGHDNDLTRACFDPSGEFLITAADSALLIWKVKV